MPGTTVASPPPPRWARMLDFLCLLLVVVAGIVAVSGGFRLRLGAVRVALTTPYRLLLWAVAIGAVRHVLAPRPPVYRDLPVRLAAWWRTPEVSTAATAVVGTRLAVLFAGYMAVFMFGYREGGAPWRLVENEFGNLPARWDTGWYMQIAVEGYRYTARRPEWQQNIVFFPALPMLMRVVGRLFGGTSVAYAWGGTAISLVAFFGALVYVYRLARDFLGEDEQARHAVWLLAAFPFALFYSAVYTESLFLIGAAGACYHFRRGELGRAGAWGLLVGLTRPNGCFLSVPLGILAVTPWLPRWLAGGSADRTGRVRERRALIPALAAAAMPGVGALLYSAWVWRLTGDPLVWAAGHAAWGRRYQGFTALIADRYEWLAGPGLYEYTSQIPADLLNALGVLFVLPAVWPVARKVGLAYAAFILVNMLPPLAAGGLLSAGRLSSVMFPAFIWFAGVVPARHRPAWLASFMAIQAFNAALFYTWRPLF